MAMQYFRKELVSNPVLVVGKRVEWEILEGNRGVKAIDDSNPANKPELDGLTDLAIKHKLGVVKIDEAEYTQKKTSLRRASLSGRPKQERLRALQPLSKKPKPIEKVVPVVNPKFLQQAQQPAQSRPADATDKNGKLVAFEVESGVLLAKSGKPLPENASPSFRYGYGVVDPTTKLRTDGPTLDEWIKAGYDKKHYPPQGFMSREVTPAFIPNTAPINEAEAQGAGVAVSKEQVPQTTRATTEEASNPPAAAPKAAKRDKSKASEPADTLKTE